MSVKEPQTTYDPRTEPAYPVAEAGRYLRLPAATLRSWFAGRSYPTSAGTSRFEPLLRPSNAAPLTLSFENLIEAHVLRSLRTDHGVALTEVRQALSYAERELRISRLLTRPELRASGGELFLEHYGELVNLSASGQLAMKRMFERHLARIEWSSLQTASRLYPFLTGEAADERPIVIDPAVSFGRPVVSGAFVSTRAILERIDAGETVEEVAGDYQVTVATIEDAVIFERAA